MATKIVYSARERTAWINIDSSNVGSGIVARVVKHFGYMVNRREHIYEVDDDDIISFQHDTIISLQFGGQDE